MDSKNSIIIIMPFVYSVLLKFFDWCAIVQLVFLIYSI